MSRVLNNRWVSIGVMVVSFILPGLKAVDALFKAVSKGLQIYNRLSNIAGELQLAGMLFQGQFKELGTALGVGVVGSYISVVTDNIVQGAQKALFGGGFDELSDLFVGAAKGAWRGVKNLGKCLFGRGLSALTPCYGNYGGPDYGVNHQTGAADNGDPVDGLDENGFKPHDDEYLAARKSGKRGGSLQEAYLNADATLVKGMLYKASFAPKTRVIDLSFGTGPSVGSRYKFLATGAFLGTMVYRKAKVIKHEYKAENNDNRLPRVSRDIYKKAIYSRQRQPLQEFCV